jgi:hypothetical protein
VALISDAFHTLFEMLAYVMAFDGSYTTERIEDSESWSYGPSRLEPVTSALNGYYWFQWSGSPCRKRTSVSSNQQYWTPYQRCVSRRAGSLSVSSQRSFCG